uniref:Uncharacterized protein n=1 Tax=Anguilla anguilla TaxID=7936 RepID=A0A0E9UL55_ANGAN
MTKKLREGQGTEGECMHLQKVVYDFIQGKHAQCASLRLMMMLFSPL